MQIAIEGERPRKGGRPKGSRNKSTVDRAFVPAGVDRLLCVEAVVKIIGMSRAWVYVSMKNGSFPPGVKFGARARRWRVSEIEAYLASRAAEWPLAA